MASQCSSRRRRAGRSVVESVLVRSDVELQVQGPVVAGVQDAEPVRLWFHLQDRVSGSVHDRRVQEALARDGRIRHAGIQRRFPGRSAARARGNQVAVRLMVGVRHGADLDASHRAPIDARRGGGVEPGPIEPAAEGVRSGHIPRIRDRHVDVGVPEIARDGGPWRSRSPGPRRVLGVNRGGVHKGLVLDDQGNADIRENLEPAGVHARRHWCRRSCPARRRP